MATISDSEFRKAQSIALEKLRKKNLMGLLAAQRNGTLQEFVRPELEAYVKRVHPGKSLPSNFQSSETSDNEVSHRYSEADLTSGNETMAAANTRKHSLPPSTKIAEVKSAEVQRASAESTNQTAKQSLEPDSSSNAPPTEPNPVAASSKFQTSKPVSSGLAARMAALNSQNAAPKNPSFASPNPLRSTSSASTVQPQMKTLGSSSHLARAKRLRSDAEFGEIVNVNMYRATILQDPTFHRKKTASRRRSLISDSLVLTLPDEKSSGNASGQSRRKSLQSLDQNTILECSSSSNFEVVDPVENPSTNIPFSNHESPSQNACDPEVDQETSVPSTLRVQDEVDVTSSDKLKDFPNDEVADKDHHPSNEKEDFDSSKGNGDHVMTVPVHAEPEPLVEIASDALKENSPADFVTNVVQETALSSGGVEDTQEQEAPQKEISEPCNETEDKSGITSRAEEEAVDHIDAPKSADENQQRSDTVKREVNSSQGVKVKGDEPTKSPMHQSSASSDEIRNPDLSPSLPSTQKDPEVRNDDELAKSTDPDASCHSPIHQTHSSNVEASNSNPSPSTSSPPQKENSSCSCCTIS
jgi:hypothetical protein